MKKRKSRFIAFKKQKWLSRAFLSLLAILILLPVILTFFYSFFSQAEIKAYLNTRGSLDDSKWMDVLLSPRTVSIGQYWTILIKDTSILNRFLLSVFYTVCVLAGQAVVVPAFAYALSAYKFRGREAIFFLLILLMLMPFQVTMVPNVLMLRQMNLLNTVWAVILPQWFTPFYIFLIRQYMIAVPRELYDAGQLDGAGPIRCYGHIVLPVCRPVIGAALTLSFADVWNMVEQPMTLLSKREDLYPLSVVFNQLIEKPEGTEFAGAVLYMLPALFIYIFFLDDIVGGIQLTELK